MYQLWIKHFYWYDHNLEKVAMYRGLIAWNHRLQQSTFVAQMCSPALVCATLAMFAGAVEASVEEADPLLQVVSF